jgi:hypothetical protein
MEDHLPPDETAPPRETDETARTLAELVAEFSALREMVATLWAERIEARQQIVDAGRAQAFERREARREREVPIMPFATSNFIDPGRR